MSENRVTMYLLPIPEAVLLASLSGIQTDLRGVIDYCDFLDKDNDLLRIDFVIWEAVCAAAVVRYARCFGSGIRKSLPAEVLANAPGAIAVDHEFFTAVRSKHVAHSVNDFEENAVVVQVGGNGENEDEIQAINTQHSRAIGLAFNEPARLKALAEWMLARVAELVERERARLLPLAQELGLARVKTFGVPELGRGASRSRAGMRRSKP